MNYGNSSVLLRSETFMSGPAIQHIAAVVGLYFGRIRGLRHLGEAEFRTRVTNVRRIGRF